MKNSAIVKLQAIALRGQLPPAWIFAGYDCDNQVAMAHEFAQWLLCGAKSGNTSCGVCKACTLFSAKSHPDFCAICPQDDKSVITIDLIRQLCDFSNSKPQQAKYKVALLYPAQALHNHAANALLKTLEEPRGDTIFILIAKHADLLPKTIVSRCQVINFGSLLIMSDEDKAIIAQMVKDLHRLMITKSVTTSQIVELWVKQWATDVLYWFEIVLTDIIRFKYTGNIALSRAWCSEEESLSKVFAASKFWAMLERLSRAQCYFGQNYKPNLQLVLEDMLLA